MEFLRKKSMKYEFSVLVMVFHGTLLADSVVASLWQRVLQTGLAIRLFRFYLSIYSKNWFF